MLVMCPVCHTRHAWLMRADDGSAWRTVCEQCLTCYWWPSPPTWVGGSDVHMPARHYGRDHQTLRAIVLQEEPFCVGYPVGIHDGEIVRTTSLDHITPISQGGKTIRSNARALCGPCNSRKGYEERRRTWRSG